MAIRARTEHAFLFRRMDLHPEEKLTPPNLDELAAEVRQGRSPPFQAWAKARAYERSLFPADTRWPVEGEVYDCVSTCEVSFLTHWKTPFTGGGTAQIFTGEAVQIRELFEAKPVVLSAVPIDYARVQSRVVPAVDCENPQFSGYSLSIRTRAFLAHFRLRQ